MDNTCVLNVKTSHGSPAWNIRVATEVSGGISCIGGRTFYTNRDGQVILKWSSGCYLRRIYIDGKGHDVDFHNGGDYTKNMR